MTGCAIDGCDRDTHARNWCKKHYDRWRRHGDTSYLNPYIIDGPPVCLCPTAHADGIGQCVRCWHPIVALHPRLISGLRCWPELAHQRVVHREEQVA